MMFLGPYQFSMAPIELMFSFIKQHDLNYMGTSLTNRNNIMRFMKEAAVCMSRLDVIWIRKAFGHVLTSALNALSLQDI